MASLPAQLLEARGRFLEGRGPGHLRLVTLLFAIMLAVGFLVERLFGWATQRLREFIVEGFTLDDERLKRGDASPCTTICTPQCVFATKLTISASDVAAGR